MKTTLKENLLIYAIPLTIFPFLLLLKNVSWDLYSSNPDLFLVSIAGVAASVTGFAGSVVLLWQYLLGIRHISKYISRDLVWINRVHKWLGKYGTLLIFVHPFMAMLNYSKNLLWVITPDLSSTFGIFVGLGRISFFSIVIIWVSSAILRGKIKFRPWKYIHFLSYPALLLMFLHAQEVGIVLNSVPVAKGLWFILLAVFILLTIYRILFAFGFMKIRYEVENLSDAGESIRLLKLKPLDKGWLKPLPGQFIYIQLSRFTEAHPFSVMEYYPEDGTILLGIKNVGRFTEKIRGLRISDTIYVDGCYGVFTKEGHNFNSKVLIAGGIGITPFVELIKQYGSESTYLFYSNRFLSEAVARDKLIESLEYRYFDCLTKDETTGANIINRRLDISSLKARLGDENITKYNYYVCGSPMFNRSVVKMLQDVGINESAIYYEDFGL